MADASRLAELISEDFYGARLDFGATMLPAGDGWSRMPEVQAVKQVRASGASERAVRLFLTFVAAMDRMRDATQLWRASAELFRTNPEVFDPVQVSAMPRGTLRDLLFENRVSKFHKDDIDAWRTIAKSLASGSGPVFRVVSTGIGDAEELIEDLKTPDLSGQPRFPLLKGAKIRLVWVRIMAEPGEARIRCLDTVPVAVDVQVRRVTENLGVTNTRGLKLNGQVKQRITNAWSAAVGAARIGGPERIAGTCSALDPALWFYGKHGCSHCESMKRRVRFGRACDSCQLPVPAPSGQRGTALSRLVRHLLRHGFTLPARLRRTMPV